LVEERHEKLRKACRNGELKKVQLILNAGVRINSIKNYEDTFLVLAASKGHLKIVELLLQAGADINLRYKNNGYERCALLAGVIGGNIEIVKIFLRNGADVDFRPFWISGYDEFCTPLRAARKKGYREIADLLVAYGAR
jgi:ankyrin repeat protein